MDTDQLVSRVQQLIGEGKSQRAACREAGIAESTYRGQVARGARCVQKGDRAEVESGAVSELPNAEVLMRSMGFSPDEWEIDKRPLLSRWGDPAQPSFQLKITLRRKLDEAWLFPAVDVKPAKLSKRAKHAGPERIVVLGDFQAPYHEPALLEQALYLLNEFVPDRVVCLGDLLDFPTISRHRDNPPFDASPQDCINSGFQILRSLREVTPGASWDLIDGNHDQRIKTELLNRAERLYGVKPAEFEEGVPEEEALSLSRLLHLDKLGINYVRNVGGYEHSEVELHPELACRHGWLVGPNAAEKSLEAMGRSVIFGHTHQRQHLWKLRGEGTRRVLRQAINTGTMSRLELGYNVASSWSQGFVTASLWPDGGFTADHAIFNEGRLLWRDRSYS